MLVRGSAVAYLVRSEGIVEMEVTVRGEDVAKKQPKPDVPELRTEQVHVMCTAEFKAWLEGFAGEDVRSVSDQIWVALDELAKKQGHRRPPKR